MSLARSGWRAHLADGLRVDPAERDARQETGRAKREAAQKIRQQRRDALREHATVPAPAELRERLLKTARTMVAPYAGTPA